MRSEFLEPARDKVHQRACEEVEHAEEVIERVLYLEGAPDVQRLLPVQVGQTVPDQINNDLKLEVEDLKILRDAITHCVQVGDYGTRHLLEEMSVDTEEHIDWLETQLETIKQVGLKNYLSEQIKKD